MFTISHKTVFVLDHSAYFAQSCNQPIEYDVLRSKGSGFIPASPIFKSLWTCSVECLQEYLRIVLDVYPREKLIRIVTGDTIINAWNCSDVATASMNKFAQLGPPNPKSESNEHSILNGLAKAVECLGQATPQQTDYLEEGKSLKNCGRIICITAVTSDNDVRTLEDYVSDTIADHNKWSISGEGLAIDKCELVVLHTVPIGKELRVAERPLKEVNANLSTEVCRTECGRQLYNKLVAMCCRHFDLTSTTVTGIPMKEEQNASSSANYDVELLHPSAAHDDMFKSEHAEGLVIPSKEGLPIETAPLKWCTPKSSVVELHTCSAAYRICPVDVNSRPSSCLTNFLLSGRAVMLEQPRRSGTKVLSHMLAAHGGDIYIHSIPTARSLLEDPPSISEGCGGRVTDYRITAFGEFMKENRLAPSTPAMVNKYGDKKGYSQALFHLERSSRFWPLVISETILFNIVNALSPLVELVVQQSLSDQELSDCKNVIKRVVAMESKNDPLPVPVSGSRGKGPKRDEQYRQLWSELEGLVRAYSETSPNHLKLLEYLLECRKPGDESSQSQAKRGKKEEKAGGSTEGEESWKELDRFQSMTEREKRDALQTDKHADVSPPKKVKTEELLMRSGGQTLLSMWSNRLKTIQTKRTHELDGRLESDGDNKSKLYIHLDEDNNAETPASTNQAPPSAMKK